MLVGNGNRLTSGPGRFNVSGNTFYAAEPFVPYGARKDFFVGEHASDSTRINGSQPSGVGHPYCWLWAIKAGGLACRNVIDGTSSLTAELYLGKDLSADLTGTGSISNANLALSTGLSADLTGTGTISSAAMVGTVQCTADLAGTGSISNAPLSMIAGLSSSLAGTCSLTANLTGLAELSADITPFTELSPQSLSAAVFATMINSLTFEEFLKVQEAFMFGKTDGFVTGGGTVHFRDAADTKNVITGVMDANKNRTSVTVNP